MKQSIQTKLAILTVGLMTMIIFLSWAVYNFKVKDFFVAKTEKNLVQIYTQINDAFGEEDNINEKDLIDIFSDTTNNTDAIILVVASDGTMYTTTNERSVMMDSLMSITKMLENPNFDKGEQSYTISQHYDQKLNSDFYDLAGFLNNGYFIAIRTSVSSVNSNIRISNKIFLYFSLIILLLGTMVMLFIGHRFSKPIHNMAIVAKRMSNLDFDAKIDVCTKDEIGELGQSMNYLSEKLEKTISELKSANAELQHDIENKTQIDDMRKEFLSHVSHELKTPIALIQGYAEGLKESINDDPENRNFYCEVIMDEANKMNEMVKKLLALNEIEFGQTQLNIERFNIVELIQNQLDSADILLTEIDAKIEYDEKKPVYVWADEYMIEEVLRNYLTNAIHHVSESGIIRITIERLDTEIRVCIFNTGHLIPEEEIDKLWIKFYKLDKARTREYGGSGIGLSIVAATMEAHGKSYGVRNCTNGVEFYFNLDADNC